MVAATRNAWKQERQGVPPTSGGTMSGAAMEAIRPPGGGTGSVPRRVGKSPGSGRRGAHPTRREVEEGEHASGEDDEYRHTVPCSLRGRSRAGMRRWLRGGPTLNEVGGNRVPGNWSEGHDGEREGL